MAGTLNRPRQLLSGQGGARLRAAALVLPLAGFIGVAFLAPLGTMLVRSVHDPVVADALPDTLALLRGWDGGDAPPESVYVAAARELLLAREERTLGQIATRVNRVEAGLRSVFTRSMRVLQGVETDDWRTAMVEADPAWGEARTWRALQRAGERWTLRHYLNAVDRERGPDGRIVRQPEEQRIYLRLFGRTFPGEPGGHGAVPAARLSACLPDRARAAAPCRAAPGRGAAAVLDVAAGAHHVVDRAAAVPGRDQRRAGGAGA